MFMSYYLNIIPNNNSAPAETFIQIELIVLKTLLPCRIDLTGSVMPSWVVRTIRVNS